MPSRKSGRVDGEPVLVDQFLNNNLGLRPYCACGHTSVIGPEQLSRVSAGTPIETIKRRLTCAACGKTGIDVAHVVPMAALGAYPHAAIEL